MNKNNSQQISIFMLLKLIKSNWILLLCCVIITIAIENIHYSLSSQLYISSGFFEVGNYNHVATFKDFGPYGDQVQADDKNAENSLRVGVQATSVSMLTTIVDKLHLDIVVVPVKFPIIGNIVYNYYSKKYPSQIVYSKYFQHKFSKYAFGGQSVDITTFDITRNLYDTPYLIRNIDQDSYLLYHGSSLVLIGTVGVLEKSKNGSVAILVKSIRAQPGQQFMLSRTVSTNIANQLASTLSVENKIADVKNTTPLGLVDVSLRGPNKKLNEKIIDTIMATLVDNSLKEQRLVLESSMSYITKQVIDANSNYIIAQTKLREFKIKNKIAGSFEKQHEITTVNLNDLEKQLDDANVALNSLKRQYGPQNPILLLTKDKISDLKKQKKLLLDKISRDPVNDDDLRRLQDDVANKLSVLQDWNNKLNQVKITLNSATSNVKIIDAADSIPVPLEAAHKKLLIVSIFGGFFVGVFIILFSIFRHKNKDPFFLEALFEIQSTIIVKYNKLLKKQHVFDKEMLNVLNSFILQLALFPDENKIIGLFSTEERVGTSSLAVVLAIVLSKQKYKVLILSYDDDNVYDDFKSSLSLIDIKKVNNSDDIKLELGFASSEQIYNFVLIDYGSLDGDLSKAETFVYLYKRIYVVNKNSDTSVMMSVGSYFNKLNIPITNVIYNYNHINYIHDFYSC